MTTPDPIPAYVAKLNQELRPKFTPYERLHGRRITIEIEDDRLVQSLMSLADKKYHTKAYRNGSSSCEMVFVPKSR